MNIDFDRNFITITHIKLSCDSPYNYKQDKKLDDF